MNLFKNREARGRSRLFTAALLSSALIITACSNDNDDGGDEEVPTPEVSITKSFSVDVINLTNAQPLSPVTGVLHTDGITLFGIGETASVEVEMVAESGDNSGVLALTGDAVLGAAASEGITTPGSTANFTIEGTTEDGNGMLLSIISMPVNTNDAITGRTNINLDALAEVGDIYTVNGRAYDAGTEANTEAAGTIPGPADGGEGFNAERDDVNFITVHSGVVTQDDGLATSVLTQDHRFDNPVVRIRVTRTQ